MKVTIKEVAREANVSIATVSRVLNGKDKVKNSTRIRIQETINKMNFSPDQAARSMTMKETKTIGLVVPKLANEYWALQSDVIQEALWAKGYTLIICPTDLNANKEAAFLKMFLERNVDGIIYGYTNLDNDTDQEIERQLKRIKLQNIPIISLTDGLTGVNCVLSDDLQGGTDAVKHLISLGHRRIGYIGSPLSARELGYHNALMLHKIPVDEEIIVRADNAFIQPSFFGYETVKSLLSRGAHFTALFCANDLIAVGAIKSLEEAGIDVPRQVSVVGFDDISIAKLYRPTLTTVHKPIAEMGRNAVDILFALIQSKDSKLYIQKKIVLPMQIIERESTAACQ